MIDGWALSHMGTAEPHMSSLGMLKYKMDLVPMNSRSLLLLLNHLQSSHSLYFVSSLTLQVGDLRRSFPHLQLRLAQVQLLLSFNQPNQIRFASLFTAFNTINKLQPTR